MKSIKLFLLVLFSFAGSLFWSCKLCGDIPEYWAFKTAKLELTNSSNEPILTDTSAVDTLFLNLVYEEDFLANLNSENECRFSFGQMAYATSCPESGDRGLKSKIEKVEFFSNRTFGSIAAGVSLDDYFRVDLSGGFYSEDAKGEGLNYFKDNILNYLGPPYIIEETKIYLIQKPMNDKAHEFTLQMITEDNDTIRAVSTPIVWQ